MDILDVLGVTIGVILFCVAGLAALFGCFLVGYYGTGLLWEVMDALLGGDDA